MSMEPRPIKVTNLADRTISGKVTAVAAVMYLDEKKN